MKKINVLSVFDGISGGFIALERAGIEVNNYFASEIDKYAIPVSTKNYPDIVRLGDIKNWKEWDIDWSSINLVLAGSPCQGFSFSGKQLAFDDPRSKLFFVFLDILNHIKNINPNVKFLLENVRMKKEYSDVITNCLGVEFIEINSNLVSAQNRKRLYWANWKISPPEDKKITWGDIRERGVDSECYYYTEKALQWLARHSRRKHKILSVHSNEEKMQMIEASHYKKYSFQRFFGIVDLPKNEQVVAAMRGRYLINNKRQDGKMLTKGKTQQYIEFRYDGKTNALTTVSKDNVVVPFTLPNRIPANEFFFRYITPLECERLQTVPEGYTEGASNSQKYKMLGNGWTIDVISHIFKGLLE